MPPSERDKAIITMPELGKVESDSEEKFMGTAGVSTEILICNFQFRGFLSGKR